jgi:hypothetical protein
MLKTDRENCYESYEKSRPQSKTRSSASYRHRLSVNISLLPVNTCELQPRTYSPRRRRASVGCSKLHCIRLQAWLLRHLTEPSAKRADW